jgi:hypothetical protein
MPHSSGGPDSPASLAAKRRQQTWLAMMFALKQMFDSKIDVLALEKLNVLFLKRLGSVMLLLIADVLRHCRHLVVTNGERTVALLPLEIML